MRFEDSADESVEVEEAAPPRDESSRDDAIRSVVARLSRPHRSGGRVIERASLLAAGSDFGAVIAWIEAHGGQPEAPPVKRSEGGLHRSRLAAPADQTPLRFILPADALG